MDHHTPPKPGSEADALIASQHLETLRLMELDTIRNLAFLHSLYYAWAPYLRVLEVKNCAGLDSSDGVPFLDAATTASAAASPCPTPAPSPLPWGRAGGYAGGRGGGTPTAPRGGRGGAAVAATPTFVVTPSRHGGGDSPVAARGGGHWRGGPSPSSRSLFSSPPSSSRQSTATPSSAAQSLLSPHGRVARPAASAPTSPYATPPRHLQPGGARSAPTSPNRSPPYGSPNGSPYSALLAALPPSLHLREVSLLKCAPPEQCIIQLVSALPNLESLDLWGAFSPSTVVS
jgi:hypothetical protein